MNKAKFKSILIIVAAWILAIVMIYLVFIKAKILFNNK